MWKVALSMQEIMGPCPDPIPALMMPPPASAAAPADRDVDPAIQTDGEPQVSHSSEVTPSVASPVPAPSEAPPAGEEPLTTPVDGGGATATAMDAPQRKPLSLQLSSAVGVGQQVLHSLWETLSTLLQDALGGDSRAQAVVALLSSLLLLVVWMYLVLQRLFSLEVALVAALAPSTQCPSEDRAAEDVLTSVGQLSSREVASELHLVIQQLNRLARNMTSSVNTTDVR